MFTKNFVFKSGGLAIGTDNVDAQFTIQGDGSRNYFSLIDKKGNSIMHIDSSGNMGVKTSTPQYSLDVNGNGLTGLFNMFISFCSSQA